MLLGAGAVALLATQAHAKDTKPSGPLDKTSNPLLDAAADCEKHAQLCLTHCMSMFAAGDTSMAACAAAVRETLATTPALSVLAAASSKHLKEMAKVCAAVCKDCEAECRKHQDKMTVCRDCADACSRMIAETNRLG
jgi:Cys-rich four helix bundle protein (predicted Tat secretion target)